jgi:uncharacterized protein
MHNVSGAFGRVRTVFLSLVLVAATVGRVNAAPILLEVFYDASGSDSGHVFTELWGEPGTVLDGWSLAGVNGGTGDVYRTIDLTGGLIPSDGVFVIAQAGASPALTAVRDFAANVDWQNGPDAVRLIDPFDLVADALQYGDAGVFNAGEGLPAPDVGAGFSLSRDLFGTDTDNNLADFSATLPSPGLGPAPPAPTPVPEPSTFLLLTAGLGWITHRCRKDGPR